jgi:glutathione S-transferase
MPRLILYQSSGACSFASHALLNELSIPHEAFRMTWTPEKGTAAFDDSISGEEYRATIHPYGYVPALKVDDEILLESVAILNYIASLAPNRPLLGNTDLERAKVLSWTTFLSGRLHAYGYAMFFNPYRFVDDESLYPIIQAKGRAVIAECYARIEKWLEGKDFPVGTAETVVDYYLMVFWYWGVRMGFDMSAHSRYEAVMRRMAEKESVKTTMRLEGVEKFPGAAVASE